MSHNAPPVSSLASADEILPRGTVLDCTLREGPYECRFDAASAATITRALIAAGVRHIEVGAETGLASRDDVNDIAAILVSKEAEPDATVGVIAGVGTASKADLQQAAAAGAAFVRVAAPALRWQEALPMIDAVCSLGLVATFNAINAHKVDTHNFARLARETTAAGAALVYLVDSAGTMLPSDVSSRTIAAREAGARVGFHGHDNLTLAVANSLAALEAGAWAVDGTLRGIGRSAGNAQLEILAAVIRLRTGTVVADTDALAQVAEEVIAPRRRRDRGVGYLDQCMGEGGFHSAGLTTALDIAAQHGVPAGPLLRGAGLQWDASSTIAAITDTAVALRAGLRPLVTPDTTEAGAE
ncbi:hypothetical protein [Streptomyces cyaneofuscatus]|uniref:hypothetical protein n=1 Tax=Streptomyces cyaneofuscatus TaxID=66883 RepID=UPI00365D747A